MYVAFALRTEPELEFVRFLFCATERECQDAVVLLCKQFADDVPVELDWAGFPDEPVPSSEQASDPSYLQTVREQIIAAFTDEPFASESEG